jgi:cell division control protein 6
MFRVKEVDLIKEPYMLRDDYVPPDLSSRDEQKQALEKAWTPALKGREPINLFFYGKPGTGKTTISKWAIEDFKKASGVPVVYVNCWERSTLYNILDTIRTTIGAGFNPKLAAEQILQDIKKKLKDQPLVVVLDEVDQSAEINSLLYLLHNVGPVGVLAIANDPGVLERLDSRVKSRYVFESMEFPNYTKNDLVEILRQRVEYCLKPGCVSEQNLGVIAEKAVGNARTAIQTLRIAAEKAEYDASEKITLELIKGGFEEAEKKEKELILGNLNADQRLIYDIAKKTPGKLSTDIFELYKQKAEKPVADRTFRKYLEDMIQKGVLKNLKVERGGAKTIEVSF